MNRHLRMAAWLITSVAGLAISLGCGPGNNSFK
jgi:hypothetical protein